MQVRIVWRKHLDTDALGVAPRYHLETLQMCYARGEIATPTFTHLHERHRGSNEPPPAPGQTA